MKTVNTIIIAALGSVALLSSCNWVLEEHPKTRYTPDFFTTPAGVEGGLTALYASLRYENGNAYTYNFMTTGTDEATFAQSADGNFKVADMSGNGVLDYSSYSGGYWTFTYINTANGIIENAESVGLDPALVAEARFFRAFKYFNLVRIFGGVPLDLGSGELKFNTTPVRTSARNTVPEVYTRCIFPDLRTAVQDLPDNPRLSGTLTKTAARIVLAQAYLTYAWWLENPEDIPTYPLCDRVDPDGHDYAWYFQEAYDLAMEAIENPGPFGLEDYFYKVYLGSNDRNCEQVLYADHTENSEQYNGSSLTYGSGGGADNFASWMLQWNYPNMTAETDNGTKIAPVLRTDNQFLGRPWTRMAPTQEALAMFDNKDKDSRYDGTFMTVYRGNWSTELTGADCPEFVYAANNMQVREGEAVLTFLSEEPATAISYPTKDGKPDPGDNAIGVGTLPGRADFVVSPDGISRRVYPGFWKWGPYRTDNGTGVGQPNAGNTRPYNIAKFSEFYFIAAEAAVKGANATYMSARDLINVIRKRAGKWTFSVAENQEKTGDYSADLASQTPATITIDYILDERLREYFGEGYRWLDLVRTQMWKEKAGQYEICGADYGDHTKQTIVRTIEDYHYLRPIPQGQLDAMTMTEEEKAVYQNPGY